MKTQLITAIVVLVLFVSSTVLSGSSVAQTYPTASTVSEYPTIKASSTPVSGSYYEGSSGSSSSKSSGSGSSKSSGGSSSGGSTSSAGSKGSSDSAGSSPKYSVPASGGSPSSSSPYVSTASSFSGVDPSDIIIPSGEATPYAGSAVSASPVSSGAIPSGTIPGGSFAGGTTAVDVPEGAQPYDPYQFATPVSADPWTASPTSSPSADYAGGLINSGTSAGGAGFVPEQRFTDMQPSGITLSQAPEGARAYDPFAHATAVSPVGDVSSPAFTTPVSPVTTPAEQLLFGNDEAPAISSVEVTGNLDHRVFNDGSTITTFTAGMGLHTNPYTLDLTTGAISYIPYPQYKEENRVTIGRIENPEQYAEILQVMIHSVEGALTEGSILGTLTEADKQFLAHTRNKLLSLTAGADVVSPQEAADPAVADPAVVAPGSVYRQRTAKAGPGTQLDGSLHVFLEGDAVVDPATLADFRAWVTITDEDGTTTSQDWALDPSMVSISPGGLMGGIDLFLIPELNGKNLSMQFYGINKKGEKVVMGNSVDFTVEMTPQNQRSVVMPDIVALTKDNRGNLIGIFDPKGKAVDRTWVKSLWAIVTDEAGNQANWRLDPGMISADGRSVALVNDPRIKSIQLYAIEFGGGLTNHGNVVDLQQPNVQVIKRAADGPTQGPINERDVNAMIRDLTGQAINEYHVRIMAAQAAAGAINEGTVYDAVIDALNQ